MPSKCQKITQIIRLAAWPYVVLRRTCHKLTFTSTRRSILQRHAANAVS
jgi:hypothetical protein